MIRRIVAALLMTLGLLYASPPVEASSTAYTKVTYINKTGFNQRIMVKCHTSHDWRTLYIGDNSNQVCGQSGWVDSIWVPDCGYLEVQNLNTGHITQYGNCYKGPIGGGYYYAWVADFP